MFSFVFMMLGSGTLEINAPHASGRWYLTETLLRTDGTPEQLLAQLRLGIPIPVGWLHQGPVVEPRGGGHWSLVIGWDPAREAVWMHDPNGEALLIGGGYVGTPEKQFAGAA
jgi:hypothetical protein